MPSHDELRRRLRLIILADVAVTVGGSAFTMIMWVLTGTTVVLAWTAAFVALCAVGMAVGLLPLRRGSIDGALGWLSASNWAAALGATAVATFSWPLLLQAAVLPTAVAAGYVTRARLLWYVVGSLTAGFAVACLGLLQDFSGLGDDVPSWTRTSVLLVFTPPMAGLVVLAAVQSGTHLDAALQEAMKAQAELAEHVEELARSRSRIVAATDRERRRIERDLHDGVQSRLVAINLRLQAARTQLGTDAAGADRALSEIRRELGLTHDELRRLAHGVYPTVLSQHGLVAAVQAAADRSPIPVRVDVDRVGRMHPDIESAVYFSMLEALQNAAKHAHASVVSVSVHRSDVGLTFEVADDGVGFSRFEGDGVGFDNMRDRLGSVGGTLSISSVEGSGTVVRGHIELPARRFDGGAAYEPHPPPHQAE